MARCFPETDHSKNGSANGPLRTIIRLATVDGVNFDLLECGHLLGNTNRWAGWRGRTRRRCLKCKSGLPVDIAPADFFRQPGDRDH